MLEILNQVDLWLFRLINQTLTCRALDYVMITVTDQRFGWVLFPVVLGVLVVERHRRGWVTFFLAIIAITCADQLSSSLLKPLFAIPRPPYSCSGVRLLVSTTDSGSFPSSHAAVQFAFATILQARHRGLGWILFPIALVVCYSRVCVGVHYPSDILGGAAVGTVCAGALLGLFWAGKRLLAKRIPHSKKRF
jgi:undecaprenyl-diphosphatase